MISEISPLWQGGVEGDCLVLVYFIMKDLKYNPLLTSPY